MHPAKLTAALMRAAVERGVESRTSTKAVAVRFSTAADVEGAEARVVAVELDGASAIEADVVVLAMGPWSSQIRCVARIRRTRPIWGLVLVSLHEFVFEDLLNRILGAIESDLRPGNGHGPGAVST